MAFDFGRVVRRTFDPLKRNPATFFGLAFLLVALPAVVIAYFQQQATADMLRQIETGGDAAALGAVGSTMTRSLLGMIVSLVTGALLQASLIHAAVADYRGGKASLGDSLSTGLKHVLPVVLISVLVGLAVTLGLFLLIIPGIFLAVKWSVSIPSQVTENTGAIGAMKRSWVLTKGRWWPIFGLFVLYIIILFVVQLLFSIPLGTTGAFTGSDPAAALEAATSPLALIVSALTATVTGAIAAAGVAALYYELRQDKDGVGAEDLADVFA